MTVLSELGQLSLIVPAYGSVYIETGVGLGDSMLCALKQPFEILHGIDCSTAALDACRQRCQDRRLELWNGTSPDVLSLVVNPDKKTVFFLDAHVEPGDGCYDPKYGECPLLEELCAILSFPWTMKPTLLIDDSEIFMSDRWWTQNRGRLKPGEWPKWQEVFDALHCTGMKWDMALRGGILYCW